MPKFQSFTNSGIPIRTDNKKSNAFFCFRYWVFSAAVLYFWRQSSNGFPFSAKDKTHEPRCVILLLLVVVVVVVVVVEAVVVVVVVEVVVVVVVVLMVYLP